MLSYVGSYGIGGEPSLSPNPKRIESAVIDYALNGSLRHVQVIGYLMRSPKAFGPFFLAVKPLSEFFDLAREVSGSLL